MAGAYYAHEPLSGDSIWLLTLILGMEVMSLFLSHFGSLSPNRSAAV